MEARFKLADSALAHVRTALRPGAVPVAPVHYGPDGRVQVPRTKQARIEFVQPNILRHPHNPATPPTAAEDRVFRGQAQATEANATFKQAFNELRPEEREAFTRLDGLMPERSDGQLALRQLVTSGKMTVGADADPSRNLIDALGDLAKAPLDPAIDRQRLLAELTQELADPVAVSQQHKGTCAATSTGQIYWSMAAPADYVDFLKGLASPDGKAKLPNGETVQRPADWRAGNDRGPSHALKPGQPRNNGRSLSSQLTEPVFMQVAIDDPLARYSNTQDNLFDPRKTDVEVGFGGLSEEQMARLMSKLRPGQQFSIIYDSPEALKQSYHWTPKTDPGAAVRKKKGLAVAWDGPKESLGKDGMIHYLKASAAVDNPIPTSVNYELDGGHAILVTRVVSKDVKAKGKTPAHHEDWVEYINPWGRYESMRAEAFKVVMQNLVVPSGTQGVIG